MNSTETEIGAYGFVNGLGYHGDQETKDRLIRRVARAVDRGDWETILGYLVAYGVGSWAGELTRQLTETRGSSWS